MDALYIQEGERVGEAGSKVVPCISLVPYDVFQQRTCIVPKHGGCGDTCSIHTLEFAKGLSCYPVQDSHKMALGGCAIRFKQGRNCASHSLSINDNEVSSS